MKLIVAVLALTSLAYGQGGGGQRLTSLKTVPVPQPTNLSTYVRDSQTLVVLGKALFWEMQAGSDGKTACATCHFHAGADHRINNAVAAPLSSTLTIAPNQALKTVGFPFQTTLRQVAGSAGMFHRAFTGLAESGASEDGSEIISAASSVEGVNVRQVTSRNAPSVINAVFNVRNFWDGRASRLFTGQTPFGASDSALNALVLRNGQLVREAVAMGNSSLASQAAGPALNAGEMSYDGRTWPLLGRKLLAASPLAKQVVSADDSVLGVFANASGNGLQPDYTYSALIQTAFQPEYWNTPVPADGSFSQIEINFPLFWALSIQAYESTLISDNTRVDQFLEGKTQSLTQLEQQGLQVFQRNNSQCTQCHQGAEFTAASFTNAANARGNNNDPDNIGFFRTGVSPLADDIGLGGLDGFGLALFLGQRNTANGTFKSPGLRNVEFTGPYFHNGSQATLDQVTQFYARNGDFPAGGNLGPGIGRIQLSATDRTALVAFLKALSDDRVRYEQAPFDHPSLCVANGAVELAPAVLSLDQSDPRFPASALENFALIPAVGKSGNTVPLQTFEELLSGVGTDGTRAHTMTNFCTPQ